MYAPNPKDIHTAHSIYLQVLGDHGFLGLFLFLTIIIWTWIVLDKIIKNTSVDLDLRWANQLARMLQLSFIAFFVAGAFLSLPYYDLFWQLVAISVIINTLVTNHSKERAAFMTDQTIAESVPFLMNSFVKNVS
jgi:O-antigen ligase